MRRVFLAGVLLLLPLAVTAFVVGWSVSFIYGFVGPGTVVGRFLTSLGLGFSSSSLAAYLIGILMVVALIYLLGLIAIVLQERLQNALDRVMRRIPLVGTVYDLSRRFVSMVDRKDADGLKSMSPVWCFFGGGRDGAAVLALLTSHQPVLVGEARYLGVLVPTAPVPIGGGLIYVPEDWVSDAEIGMDQLMSIYVSMGVTPPKDIAVPASRVPSTPGAQRG
ncbi:DUF502 domain-containing protein [Phreatobacter sp.]|uniref:DUF502 domain-containing protein n=1 Tax=Phreatobacter sp. TaxID=1966341 RepID=UPI0022CAF6EB|nr:DUF502 domain-containing protein [Phreatobacter sp.]MCZ8315267.1 DUF502 domain-containing protein [Phreatobacter sp.]